MGSLSSLSPLRLPIFLFFIADSSLSLSNLFGGLKNQTSGGADNLIICTIRYQVHYTRVYDTVLVDKVGRLAVIAVAGNLIKPAAVSSHHNN